MLDTRQEGDSYRRIAVITGQSRQRRWTTEDKARIVAESLEGDANISEVVRRNGVARWAAHGMAAPIRGGSTQQGACAGQGPSDRLR